MSLFEQCYHVKINRLVGILVGVHSPRVWEILGPIPGRVKPDLKIGIDCFSTKHETLRSKNKDCLARSQYNVSEWGDMSFCRLLLQCANTIKIQLCMLV